MRGWLCAYCTCRVRERNAPKRADRYTGPGNASGEGPGPALRSRPVRITRLGRGAARPSRGEPLAGSPSLLFGARSYDPRPPRPASGYPSDKTLAEVLRHLAGRPYRTGAEPCSTNFASRGFSEVLGSPCARLPSQHLADPGRLGGTTVPPLMQEYAGRRTGRRAMRSTG
jgi:hypothetical protein